MPSIAAVVPVKQWHLAKQRLSPLLTPHQRAAFAACMLEDVLDAVVAVPGISAVFVVTADDGAAALARRYGAAVVTEGARAGLNPAVASGCRAAAEARHGGVLILPGDIPAVTAGDLAAVLAAHGSGPGFTIVPSCDGGGSNAVLCAPPGAVPSRYGPASFAAHLAAARAVGIAPTIIRLAGIALDIDDPADVMALVGMGLERRSVRYLAGVLPGGWSLDSAKG